MSKYRKSRREWAKRQRIKKQEEWFKWPIKCEDGTLDILPLKHNGAFDSVPYIVSRNRITKGRYLKLGKGFIVKAESMKTEGL